jgi:tetratricopeptide (TPR) repeat protein
MDLRGRPDRSGTWPRRTAVAGAGDLLGDLHRQQRLRVLRRAASITALALVLLLAGLAVKFAVDRRARAQSLDLAATAIERGTAQDVAAALQTLEASLAADPSHGPTLAARALARAQLAVEFGEGVDEARAAVEACASLTAPADVHLARALLAILDGDGARAKEHLAATSDTPVLLPLHRRWVEGMLARLEPGGDGSARAAAIAQLQGAAAGDARGATVAERRLLAALLLDGGQADAALSELAKVRELSRTHLGLAADEALFNAALRRELSGVADVAEQLLSGEAGALAPRDAVHAELARGVVRLQVGELDDGLAEVRGVWPRLAPWEHDLRALALQSVLEAGDGELAKTWLEQAALSPVERSIYEAWGQLARGDVTASLAALAQLPQEHPRVGYLQALALVEQGRHAEALPWIERTERLIPGRVEIDVARARVELRVGDRAAALRKLEALTEQEPYAPRAWTGLGEAHLLQSSDAPPSSAALRAAQKAFERALERERIPAEAQLRLAEVWRLKRPGDADAERRALELEAKAVESNGFLPHYRERLAHSLAKVGRSREALALLEALADSPATSAASFVLLADLRLTLAGAADPAARRTAVDAALEQAKAAGAAPDAITIVRARLAVLEGEREGLEAARDELVPLLAAQPQRVDARVLLVKIYTKLADREGVEREIRLGIAAGPEPLVGRLYLESARFLGKQKKYGLAAARARTAWRSMLDEGRPAAELVEAARITADLWNRQKKERVSLQVVRELTDRLPEVAAAWTVRGAIQLAAGLTAEARASAEKAIDLDDDSARAHELRGHALLRFGLKDDAKQAYERALALASGTPDEAEYRENLRRL